MSLNQNIRYDKPNPAITTNPESLFDYLVAPLYLSGAGAPPADIGSLNSVYIDLVSGIEYVMDRTGVWNPYINFTSLVPAGPTGDTGATGATGAIGATGATGATGAAAVISDPLILNQLNVNTIA